MARAAASAAAAFACALGAALASAQPLATTLSFAPSGDYAVSVAGKAWLQSPAGAAPTVCVAGNASVPLVFKGLAPASGADAFGAWSGQTASYVTSDASAARVTLTAQNYAARPAAAVFTAAFPDGLDTSNCGSTAQQSTRLPAFDVGAALAPTLGFLSWRDGVLSNTVNAQGLSALKQGGAIDCGPVVATDGASAAGNSLVWSTLDSHKIVVQATSAAAGGAPLTSLWSAERADQVACLSDLCRTDQVAQGNYVVQRVEGYGFASADVTVTEPATGAGTVTLGGRQFATLPLIFAWSSAKVDNFVSNASAPLPADGSYSVMGDNGSVLADGSAPNSLPLKLCSRVYNASHTDWAALASADGLAWATANGYKCNFGVAGYVLAAAPPAGEGLYSLGLSAAVPSIPAGWSYSVLFSGAAGGFTAATYAWGAAIQSYYGTYRLPSVTLTDVGYYTDDGAYYYVWEAFGCCDPVHHAPRPWPAEEGLVVVKEDLWARGVPVAYMQVRNPHLRAGRRAHAEAAEARAWRRKPRPPRAPQQRRTPCAMSLSTRGACWRAHRRLPFSLSLYLARTQLDDWWYNGRFYFGNVKVIEDWHASNSSRLFPNGTGLLADFQARLGLPLQLYAPFWSSDKFDVNHVYNMTESTVFSGTKLVTPNDSARFFSDFFDLGATLTGGAKNFVAFEIDFLDSNFQGSASMFESVYAADLWYAGMADAAFERGLVIQSVFLCGDTFAQSAPTLSHH